MTELIWDGKYDKDGRRVAPVRVALPFQTVETVNESVQERQLSMDRLLSGRDPEWRNRLIWGDKKYVLPSLLDQFAGKVDLIYIDPPFDTGADFSFQVQVDGEEFTKEPSVIEQKAYRDTWGRGLDSYLQWFYEAALVLRELLSSTGSIYVHLDWHVGPYIKAVLDEVFGSDNFRNEIIWQRTASHNDPKRYGVVHDTVFFYTKTGTCTWNGAKTKQSPDYIESFFIYAESPDGEVVKLRRGEEAPSGWRRFRLGNFASPHPRPNLTYEYKGYKPPKNGWKVSPDRMAALDQQGRLYFPPSKDGRIQTKSYLDEVEEGKAVSDLWTGILALQAGSKETMGFPTQKPESLLERIIRASSNEGDFVLDCFVGSGTTAAVAEKLGRRWIAADLGRFAVHTTRKRLLGIPNVRPFVVQNLGKYERQAWQVAEFGEEAESRTMKYRWFILDLYKAKLITGYSWLHGVRSGRMVHVGTVDAPVSTGDVAQIAAEFRRSVGTGADAPRSNGVDVLGWDFAFELNEVARQQAALANIDMRFVRIPREVLEKRAVEQGDIRFFELAALSVAIAQKGKAVTLTLTDFVIPLDDVPEDVQRAITNWAQWIDYWAVDWDNKGDAFHNQWQAYRTRQSRELQKSISYSYDQPGKYRIVVKVIDILGNDTTKTLEVEVG